MSDNPDMVKKMDFRKGVKRPDAPEIAEPDIEGATEDSISGFVEATKAAKANRANRPTGWRRFFRRR